MERYASLFNRPRRNDDGYKSEEGYKSDEGYRSKENNWPNLDDEFPPINQLSRSKESLTTPGCFLENCYKEGKIVLQTVDEALQTDGPVTVSTVGNQTNFGDNSIDEIIDVYETPCQAGVGSCPRKNCAIQCLPPVCDEPAKDTYCFNNVDCCRYNAPILCKSENYYRTASELCGYEPGEATDAQVTDHTEIVEIDSLQDMLETYANPQITRMSSHRVGKQIDGYNTSIIRSTRPSRHKQNVPHQTALNRSIQPIQKAKQFSTQQVNSGRASPYTTPTQSNSQVVFKSPRNCVTPCLSRCQTPLALCSLSNSCIEQKCVQSCPWMTKSSPVCCSTQTSSVNPYCNQLRPTYCSTNNCLQQSFAELCCDQLPVAHSVCAQMACKSPCHIPCFSPRVSPTCELTGKCCMTQTGTDFQQSPCCIQVQPPTPPMCAPIKCCSTQTSMTSQQLPCQQWSCPKPAQYHSSSCAGISPSSCQANKCSSTQTSLMLQQSPCEPSPCPKPCTVQYNCPVSNCGGIAPPSCQVNKCCSTMTFGMSQQSPCQLSPCSKSCPVQYQSPGYVKIAPSSCQVNKCCSTQTPMMLQKIPSQPSPCPKYCNVQCQSPGYVEIAPPSFQGNKCCSTMAFGTSQQSPCQPPHCPKPCPVQYQSRNCVEIPPSLCQMTKCSQTQTNNIDHCTCLPNHSPITQPQPFTPTRCGAPDCMQLKPSAIAYCNPTRDTQTSCLEIIKSPCAQSGFTPENRPSCPQHGMSLIGTKFRSGQQTCAQFSATACNGGSPLSNNHVCSQQMPPNSPNRCSPCKSISVGVQKSIDSCCQTEVSDLACRLTPPFKQQSTQCDEHIITQPSCPSQNVPQWSQPAQGVAGNMCSASQTPASPRYPPNPNSVCLPQQSGSKYVCQNCHQVEYLPWPPAFKSCFQCQSVALEVETPQPQPCTFSPARKSPYKRTCSSVQTGCLTPGFGWNCAVSPAKNPCAVSCQPRSVVFASPPRISPSSCSSSECVNHRTTPTPEIVCCPNLSEPRQSICLTPCTPTGGYQSPIIPATAYPTCQRSKSACYVKNCTANHSIKPVCRRPKPTAWRGTKSLPKRLKKHRYKAACASCGVSPECDPIHKAFNDIGRCEKFNSSASPYSNQRSSSHKSGVCRSPLPYYKPPPMNSHKYRSASACQSVMSKQTSPMCEVRQCVPLNYGYPYESYAETDYSLCSEIDGTNFNHNSVTSYNKHLENKASTSSLSMTKSTQCLPRLKTKSKKPMMFEKIISGYSHHLRACSSDELVTNGKNSVQSFAAESETETLHTAPTSKRHMEKRDQCNQGWFSSLTPLADETHTCKKCSAKFPPRSPHIQTSSHLKNLSPQTSHDRWEAGLKAPMRKDLLDKRCSSDHVAQGSKESVQTSGQRKRYNRRSSSHKTKKGSAVNGEAPTQRLGQDSSEFDMLWSFIKKKISSYASAKSQRNSPKRIKTARKSICTSTSTETDEDFGKDQDRVLTPISTPQRTDQTAKWTSPSQITSQNRRTSYDTYRTPPTPKRKQHKKSPIRNRQSFESAQSHKTDCSSEMFRTAQDYCRKSETASSVSSCDPNNSRDNLPVRSYSLVNSSCESHTVIAEQEISRRSTIDGSRVADSAKKHRKQSRPKVSDCKRYMRSSGSRTGKTTVFSCDSEQDFVTVECKPAKQANESSFCSMKCVKTPDDCVQPISKPRLTIANPVDMTCCEQIPNTEIRAPITQRVTIPYGNPCSREEQVFPVWTPVQPRTEYPPNTVFFRDSVKINGSGLSSLHKLATNSQSKQVVNRNFHSSNTNESIEQWRLKYEDGQVFLPQSSGQQKAVPDYRSQEYCQQQSEQKYPEIQIGSNFYNFADDNALFSRQSANRFCHEPNYGYDRECCWEVFPASPDYQSDNHYPDTQFPPQTNDNAFAFHRPPITSPTWTDDFNTTAGWQPIESLNNTSYRSTFQNLPNYSQANDRGFRCDAPNVAGIREGIFGQRLQIDADVQHQSTSGHLPVRKRSVTSNFWLSTYRSSNDYLRDQPSTSTPPHKTPFVSKVVHQSSAKASTIHRHQMKHDTARVSERPTHFSDYPIIDEPCTASARQRERNFRVNDAQPIQSRYDTSCQIPCHSRFNWETQINHSPYIPEYSMSTLQSPQMMKSSACQGSSSTLHRNQKERESASVKERPTIARNPRHSAFNCGEQTGYQPSTSQYNTKASQNGRMMTSSLCQTSPSVGRSIRVYNPFNDMKHHQTSAPVYNNNHNHNSSWPSEGESVPFSQQRSEICFSEPVLSHGSRRTSAIAGRPSTNKPTLSRTSYHDVIYDYDTQFNQSVTPHSRPMNSSERCNVQGREAERKLKIGKQATPSYKHEVMSPDVNFPRVQDDKYVQLSDIAIQVYRTISGSFVNLKKMTQNLVNRNDTPPKLMIDVQTDISSDHVTIKSVLLDYVRYQLNMNGYSVRRDSVLSETFKYAPVQTSTVYSCVKKVVRLFEWNYYRRYQECALGICLTNPSYMNSDIKTVINYLQNPSSLWTSITHVLALCSAVCKRCLKLNKPQLLSGVLESFIQITERIYESSITSAGGWNSFVNWCKYLDNQIQESTCRSRKVTQRFSCLSIFIVSMLCLAILKVPPV